MSAHGLAGRMLVTSQLVETWCRAAQEGATMGTMRQLLRVWSRSSTSPCQLLLRFIGPQLHHGLASVMLPRAYYRSLGLMVSRRK